MTAASCTPVSYPRLPPTHAHPRWQAWDMAAEMCLLQLPQLLADPSLEFQPSSFFTEQLTAFELWLSQGSRDKKPPEQLPIVLQVGFGARFRSRAPCLHALASWWPLRAGGVRPLAAHVAAGLWVLCRRTHMQQHAQAAALP